MLTGVNASDGIGIGKAVVAIEPDLTYKATAHNDPEAERARYQKALDDFCARTQEQADRMAVTVGEEEAQIMAGHIMMAQDPFMMEEVGNRIDSGMGAEQAVDEACEMFSGMFESMEDALMRERAADVKDIRLGLLANLLGKQVVDLSSLQKDSIVVIHDLTPSMTATIDKDHVVGIITETGGRTSHSAIIARALEIPAVLSVENALQKITQGDTCVVDGTKGEITLNPDATALKGYQKIADEVAEAKAALNVFKGKETVTGDGEKRLLVANIGTPEEAINAAEHDAEGVGLFRSEFLFMDASELPSENEQFVAYQKVALRMKDKPVIIRTLDVGGDKEIPYLGLTKEENPFMGNRAVRYCLINADKYKVQLRALLRASAFGDVKIMVPLVTCVEEIRAVKKLVEECKEELRAEGTDFNENIEVGTMMETPAASLIADDLAAECDFFSIGTNDLIGYTMCVDRGNDSVAYLYSVYNPAVLRSIQRIIKAGNDANIMVGMCGEAAADPLLIPLLISFGLDEFSVSAPSILKTRKIISEWKKADADKLAAEVMELKTAAEVKEKLASAVK